MQHSRCRHAQQGGLGWSVNGKHIDRYGGANLMYSVGWN